MRKVLKNTSDRFVQMQGEAEEKKGQKKNLSAAGGFEPKEKSSYNIVG